MSMDNLDRSPAEQIVETDPLQSPEPNPDASPKLSIGRLAVPLFLQSLLICSIPFQSIYALATGTTVILKTMPVDPYDLLRGYYQTLSYDISSFNTLRKLPGWAELNRDSSGAKLRQRDQDTININQQVYVTLSKITATNSQTPVAWQPIAIGDKLSVDLSADKIAIKGTSNGSSIVYGLETYYMPEDRKDSVNRDINQAQSSGGKRNLLVEIKVDNRGLATPVSLWVGSKQYQF
jgi:uncharacterized membrane-anchored protein